MEISIKWKNAAEKWELFPLADIISMSRSHALNLFSRAIPVVIRQDDVIVSNDIEMRNLYRKKGSIVMDLASLAMDNGSLGSVGFI